MNGFDSRTLVAMKVDVMKLDHRDCGSFPSVYVSTGSPPDESERKRSFDGSWFGTTWNRRESAVLR